MKKIFAGLGILSLILGVAVPVWAGTEAGVAATVTPKLVSISVSPDSVAYGTVALDTETAPTGDPVITATNDGNVTENFNIKGADATYDAYTWTLSDTANGDNQYMYKFETPAYSDPYTPLTVSYQSLATGIAALGTQDLKLKIETPTSTSAYGEYSTTVTVQATE